jgi:hypothetical protein
MAEGMFISKKKIWRLSHRAFFKKFSVFKNNVLFRVKLIPDCHLSFRREVDDRLQ